MPRGGEKARFSQKPLEAAVTIEAYLEAFHVTDDQVWAERADHCLNWFLGENDLSGIGFDGTGDYYATKGKNAVDEINGFTKQQANDLAGILDVYNNGNLCI